MQRHSDGNRMMKHMLLLLFAMAHSLLSTVWKLIELEERLCVCVCVRVPEYISFNFICYGIRHHCLMDKKQHTHTLAQQEERASETRKNAAQNRFLRLCCQCQYVMFRTISKQSSYSENTNNTNLYLYLSTCSWFVYVCECWSYRLQIGMATIRMLPNQLTIVNENVFLSS